MIAKDEDALTCDFAETYHLLDMRELRPEKAAVLACGLSPSSRIMMKLGDRELTIEQTLLAGIADRLTILISAGSDRPPTLILDSIGKKSSVMAFATPEEWEAARAAMIGV